MLHSMRLRNLRSFSNKLNSPFIDLKPLTVLVGKNSSGKSSFIRSLPLLRQSVEARTTGPILWYGSYVDFGAYSEAKKNDSADDTIYFDFRLIVSSYRLPSKNLFFGEAIGFGLANSSEKLDIIVSLGITEVDKKTIAKEITIKVFDFEYTIKFNQDESCSLYINNEEQISSDKLMYSNRNSFLPKIYGVEEIQFSMDGEIFSRRALNEHFISQYYTNKMEKIIRNYCHKNTSQEKIERSINSLGVFKQHETKEKLLEAFSSIPSFIKNINKEDVNKLTEVYKLSHYKEISNLVRIVNSELEGTFAKIRYIAPLRATAERYYRHQDLQVEEIDHTGSNLAMLLKSLSRSETQQFSRWTLSNFGFKVRVHELGLHYALKIQTENSKKEYNINDMGFGFSQILPIIASVWLESRKDNFRRNLKKDGQIIFAIEQPELHLHPEYQSKLARMFSSVIKAAKNNGITINIIFETHSKTMIDTIGDCIEEGIISKDDVNISLFEKELDDESTKVSFSSFDDYGNLESWPVGFFSGR